MKVTDGIKFFVGVARYATTLLPRFMGWRWTDDVPAQNTVYGTFNCLGIEEITAIPRYYTAVAGITRNDAIETLVEYIVGG